MRRVARSLTLVILVTLAVSAKPARVVRAQAGASTPDSAVARVLNDAKVKQAIAAIDRDHDRLVSEIVTLTEIPSPPFGEDKRGAAYLEMLRQTGLVNVERDAEGNVMGLRRGAGGGPMIAIA